MSFSEYIDNVIKSGKYSFTIEHALKTLNKSRKAIVSSIEHLLAKNELASPARGFYVIVPPEYQILGCLPAEYFIPDLMKYWNCQYYACLLTAAKYHGASHQAVMIFQAMTEKPRRPISCGKIRIKFITNKKLAKTPIQQINTRMSILTVSTPEGTAMDLLNYPKQSVGLSHIATVLTELQEAMDVEKLESLAKANSVLAWQQRLGYMLDLVNAKELADVLKNNLAKQKRIDYIPLANGIRVKKNAKKNETWKIIENTTIESDI